MAFNSSGEDCISRLIDGGSVSTELDEIDHCYDIEATVKWLAERNVENVCLQFPDDLLRDSVAVCKRIRQLTNSKVYMVADSTYDSCCVDELSAKHVDGDAIVHYGDSCLSPSSFPVFYVFPKRQLDIERTVRTLNETTNAERTTVVVYDIAYQHMADDLCESIFRSLSRVIVGRIYTDRGIDAETVCGRSLVNSSNERVGLQVLQGAHIVYIGAEGPTVFNLTVSGKALEVSLLDPALQTLSPQSQLIWLKRRRYLIERVKDANRIGIVVATPNGINARQSIRRARDVIKAAGKRGYVLSVGRPNPAKLANITEIDVYVLIACPHSSLFSSRDFLSPIVHLAELESALEFADSRPTDVSLVTGLLRNLPDKRQREIEGAPIGTAVAVKDRQDVAELMELSANRSWHGLRLDEGLTGVRMAEDGRRGVAGQYESEPK